ncbi:hypothetical protein [Sphingomonas sp. CARO-RG-8B-R24-01]|uniref:hypothetical protein n=1 Tax=Sphingomonas sp. CARO-RG-8B-R24-01 TaxID=2914831 RepID=UPI001F56B47D|nr:hypothetical protein [Sphingomonas sp. CARO-RG-8B-R24-01]
MIPPLIRFGLPLLLIWIWSMRQGGAPERVGASTLLAAEIASYLAAFVGNRRFLAPDMTTTIIDAALIVALGVLALRANRLWPTFLLATHMITVLSHFDIVVNRHLRPLGYAVMQIAPAYLGLAVLGAGIWRYHHRTIQNGAEPSWRRPSSSRSAANAPPPAPIS